MNNVKVCMDLQNLLATPQGSHRMVSVDLQWAGVNFSVLGKTYNLSMKKEQDRRIFLFFTHFLKNRNVAAVLDGDFVFGQTDKMLPTVHKTTRLIILEGLPILEAIIFRTTLRLKESGYFPLPEKERSNTRPQVS